MDSREKRTPQCVGAAAFKAAAQALLMVSTFTKKKGSPRVIAADPLEPAIPDAAVEAGVAEAERITAAPDLEAERIGGEMPEGFVVRAILTAAVPHLVTDRSAESELFAEARVLAGELRAMAEGHRLPGNDVVGVSVVLWAEGWLLTLAEVGVRPEHGRGDDA